MILSTQPYKGARDFYPEDKRLQKHIFKVLRRVVESYGYQEYDAPIIEPFDIYAAKSGEELVNEQLYSFEDRGGRKVAIRPEMTPSVSRMVAARRQELGYPLRLYSIPNLWRYERPQRGRLREHYQLNVDFFGDSSLTAEAEIIQVADSIFKAFSAPTGSYRININSRQAMIQALEGIGVTEDGLKAVYKLVDKMPKIEEEEFDRLMSEHLGREKAEKLRTYLKGEHVPDNVRQLLDFLKSAGIDTVVYEPSVVRGLDYYTDIVFEIFDTNPENPRAMLGGGRYDGLVGMFGVEPVPTVGFGMGDVTLQNFLESHILVPELKSEIDAVAILVGDVYKNAQEPISKLRAQGVNLAVDMTSRKLDSQINHAAKSGTDYVIFIGESELSAGHFKLKNLKTGEEQELSPDQIAEKLHREHKP